MIFIIYINIQLFVANGRLDQWGNITTGTELVRRMNGNSSEEGAKAFA